MAQQINSVVIAGNLTRDPELRQLPSGTSVCSLRIANNRDRKNGATGEWDSHPGYYDVTVWGKQGENCARWLSKGRPCLVLGELQWREWEAKDGSGKRQSVDIKANEVQFLGGRDEGERPVSTSDIPTPQPAGAPAGSPSSYGNFSGGADGDDDIPFLFDNMPGWLETKTHPNR